MCTPSANLVHNDCPHHRVGLHHRGVTLLLFIPITASHLQSKVGIPIPRWRYERLTQDARTRSVIDLLIIYTVNTGLLTRYVNRPRVYHGTKGPFSTVATITLVLVRQVTGYNDVN